MAFRTIVAKYRGSCRRCGGVVEPGDKIRFGGRGRTYHLLADCPGADDGDRSVRVPDFGGRCEDAPCCGHGGRCGVPLGYGASFAGVEF